jgi:hypothetical protein
VGNIKNFNFNNLDLKLSKSDYWDFYLANDDRSGNCDALLSGSCSVVWYDFNNTNIYVDNNKDTIYSLFTWDGATNTGYTLNTVGLTGIDNGLITFDKTSGDTSNQALLSALTESVLSIPSGDTRFMMNRVTGTTSDLNYAMDYGIDVIGGAYAKFLGGFYQGYYKLDGTTYQLLPTRVEHSWSTEFWIKPEFSGETSGTTLNDLYPNNKGMFFYMGTRAENKFWNQWDGADTGCTSGCTSSACTSGETVSEWCTIPKESEITLVGEYGIGIPLAPPQVEVDLITNNFLIYGRGHGSNGPRYTGDTGLVVINEPTGTTANPLNCGCRGCTGSGDGLGSQTVCSYSGGTGIAVRRVRKTLTNEQNPFLIYGRAQKSGRCGCRGCAGSGDGLGNETVCSFSGRTSPLETMDYNLDIIDNAIGFRIKDDGSIGYRLLTVTGKCETINGERINTTGVTIEERYSASGTVETDVWSYIVLKFVTDYKSECDLTTAHQRKGKLMVYVNGKLKQVFDNFSEFIARRLDEHKSKQVGVPFNFSLGGGTQGLLESQTFDGLDPNDRNLPIETNFAGSFIGSISQFKFNICELKYCNIIQNFNDGVPTYRPLDTNLLLQEDGDYLLLEDGYGLLWN